MPKTLPFACAVLTLIVGCAQHKPAPAEPAPAASAPASPPAASQPTPSAPPATPEPAKENGVLKTIETDSGLIIEELKFGDGAECKPLQTVTIHYRGTLPDGKEFDSSHKTGRPATFPLGSLIKGWQEGIPGMKIGGKRRLIVPPDLAYGSREFKDANGTVLIPANATLIFEIELFGVQ